MSASFFCYYFFHLQTVYITRETKTKKHENESTNKFGSNSRELSLHFRLSSNRTIAPPLHERGGLHMCLIVAWLYHVKNTWTTSKDSHVLQERSSGCTLRKPLKRKLREWARITIMADNYRKSSHPGRLFQIKKKTGTLITGTRVIKGGGGGGGALI